MSDLKFVFHKKNRFHEGVKGDNVFDQMPKFLESFQKEKMTGH